MGYENLYGQGRGQAQVFNSSGIVNTYARQLQMEGASRQKEREAYAKELENISWDGARQADEPYFRKKWETILDLNHKRSITDKKEDKISLNSQIQTLKKEMMSDAKRSVSENKTDMDIAAMPLTKSRYEMPNNFGDILKARRTTSIFDPSFSSYGTDKFQVQAKPYDVNSNLMELANIASKEVSTKSISGKGIDAKYKYNEGKQLDEGAFKTAFLDNIASDDHARDTYLKGLDPTPENLDAASHAAYEIVKDKFATKERDGGYVDPSGRQLAISKELARYSNSLPSKAGHGEEESIYRQRLIGRAFEGEKEALDEVKSYLPSGSTFNLFTSHKDEKAGSKGGYKLIRLLIPAGVYNGVPMQEVKEDISFSKGDPMNRLNSILNQYTGERISPSKLNTVGGKTRGTDYNVKPSNTGQSVKSYSSSQEDLIKKNLKANPAYTRDEIIKALGL